MKDEKALASFINEHVAFKAADDVKRLSAPQTPDSYKIELPSDFRPPEGVDFTFRDNDPLLAQARTMAHGMGMSQENFSKLLGLYAGAQVSDQQQIATAKNTEIAKLGPSGPARVTAINTWFDAMGTPGLKGRLFTAADVAEAEKLITRFSTQGSGQFRANGRVPPEPAGRVTDAEYEKMSYSERKDYAERHSNGAAA